MYLFGKHPFLDLNLGLVKENFVIAKRRDLKLWEERGFRRIRKYPVFHYLPNPLEVIMLGRPLTIAEFTPEKLINSKISDYCEYLGTYGMGGPGFFGLKLEGTFGIRWLVYCIWLAGEHLLLDDKIIECHSKFHKKYRPWLAYGTGQEYEQCQQALRDVLSGLEIRNVDLQEHALTIQLSDGHVIKTFRKSSQFPEQGGTLRKRAGYETGTMSDCWLVIYDETHLSV